VNDAPILAADIGATKSILGMFPRDDGAAPLLVRRVPTRDYASLEALVREALPEGASAETGCFGIPGPVVDGASDVTNLGWTVDEGRLGRALGLQRAILINDVEAMAYGIPMVESAQRVILNAGRPVPASNAALIAAGTGLGESILFWNGQEHVPMAGEGGHGDFAPRTPLEAELLAYLQRSIEHVSWERVLSGAGLVSLYGFLRERGTAPEQDQVAAAMRHEDPSSVISRAGLSRACALSVAALELFATLYGAEAGNLALLSMATAGVYLGGGIAAKIADKLRDGAFMKAFVAKDRMEGLLGAVPVQLILDESVGMLGAARVARLRGRAAQGGA
jgi:glucokinase